MSDLGVSIIINNYNYGRFLGDSIKSALNQTVPALEVIVVDDGSSDNSLEVIKGFGDQVTVLIKSNGGQASAFNAGFIKSKGDIIIFLDSDDVLLSSGLQNIISVFDQKDIVKLHWPLHIIDEFGKRTGEIKPKDALPAGDFREMVQNIGPPFCPSAPTSGNAWSREFLEVIFPIPEFEFRIGADTFLFELAPFFGIIQKLDEPQSCYRVHTKNNYHSKTFTEKLNLEITLYNALLKYIDINSKRLNIKNNIKLWWEKSWFHLLAASLNDIKKITQKGVYILLIDDGRWNIGNLYDGRNFSSFIEEKGNHIGSPLNGEHAVKRLEKKLESGIDYIVFAWDSFWWLEYYPELSNYLQYNFNCLLKNDRIIVFDASKKVTVQ